MALVANNVTAKEEQDNAVFAVHFRNLTSCALYIYILTRQSSAFRACDAGCELIKEDWPIVL